MLPLCLDAKRV